MSISLQYLPISLNVYHHLITTGLIFDVVMTFIVEREPLKQCLERHSLIRVYIGVVKGEGESPQVASAPIT